MNRHNVKRTAERGMAMIFALVLILVLSVLAASLLFVSRAETWSSYDYRMMSQGRYGAEAGVNAAANYLINAYTPPGVAGPDQYVNYTQIAPPIPVPNSASVATVEYHGDLVALVSGNPTVPFAYGYPHGAGVSSAFNNTVAGTINSGNDLVNYTVYATLLSMEQLPIYGQPPTNPGTLQTWLITADGNVNGAQNSQVEVSAVLERPAAPVFEYGAFATGNGCGALGFGGGGSVNSYNSMSLSFNGGNVVTQNFDGNVGSNGNLNEGGSSTTIYGTMSTPAQGVGGCASGNVTAWSVSGNPTVTGGLVSLPQAVNYPTPTVPPPGAGTTTVSHGTTNLAPGNYGDISVGSQGNLALVPGTYNINSLSVTSNNATITIMPDPVTGLYGPVILNVTGNNTGNPISLTGNCLVNGSYASDNFQIMYAGTGEIDLTGNSSAAGVVYAPNATVKLNGNGDWYGAIIGQTVNDTGGAGIHYDRALQNEVFTLGNWELDTFTWKKY